MEGELRRSAAQLVETRRRYFLLYSVSYALTALIFQSPRAPDASDSGLHTTTYDKYLSPSMVASRAVSAP